MKPHELKDYIEITHPQILFYVDPHDRYCVQKTGPNILIIHDARNFSEGLPFGEYERTDVKWSG